MAKREKNKTSQMELIADALLAKLADLGDITQRKMFGGIGIFCNKKMFALINRSATAFLKTDAQSAGQFEDMGSKKFGNMPYHEIPESVLANTRKLKTWAKKSIRLTQPK